MFGRKGLGWALISIGFALPACGKSSSVSISPLDSEPGEVYSPPTSPPSSERPPFSFCLTLSFDGVQAFDIFKLALNLTGSYEGNDGWKNITNNFDGQGMSLGLLSQNFGQGSLQPLLIQMRDGQRSLLQQLFSNPHFESVLQMLGSWEGSSPKDNAGSVNWATQNLYAGSNFISSWKLEFQNLAQHPSYVQLQVNAASNYESYSWNSLSDLKIAELRSYLFLFDVRVQNGGFYRSDIKDYRTYLKDNAQSTEEQRLLKLLELRLRHVRPEYKADVEARKRAIILGFGRVHGANRNFPQEYCAPMTKALF